MHLSAVDLNLLVALHALLDTQSVKLAAERVALSPSAMSRALGRLRDLFDDPLLVRSGQTLTRTPHAERLRAPLARLLDDTNRLLGELHTFDPSGAAGAFTLGTNDYTERMLVVPLGVRFARLAPQMNLYSKRCESRADDLRHEAVDLAFGSRRNSPADILWEPLYDEEHVCLLRRGHPALQQALTPERYAALSHILIAPGGTPVGVVDERLAELGLSRRVSRTVATFTIAPQMVCGSDHIVTMAGRIARSMAEELDLVVVPAPFPVQVRVGMAWHRRNDGDPAHRWLREQVRSVAAAV